MPALDSLEAIQRGASLCLFILGCRTFARLLEDCSNAKIVGRPSLFSTTRRHMRFSIESDVAAIEQGMGAK